MKDTPLPGSAHGAFIASVCILILQACASPTFLVDSQFNPQHFKGNPSVGSANLTERADSEPIFVVVGPGQEEIGFEGFLPQRIVGLVTEELELAGLATYTDEMREEGKPPVNLFMVTTMSDRTSIAGLQPILMPSYSTGNVGGQNFYAQSTTLAMIPYNETLTLRAIVCQWWRVRDRGEEPDRLWIGIVVLDDDRLQSHGRKCIHELVKLLANGQTEEKRPRY